MPSETIIPFINQASTTIGYAPSLKAQYGPVPKVEVWYWDGTKYNIAGMFTDVRMQLSSTGYEAPIHPGGSPPPPEVLSITVNHGGVSTGIIKIE